MKRSGSLLSPLLLLILLTQGNPAFSETWMKRGLPPLPTPNNKWAIAEKVLPPPISCPTEMSNEISSGLVDFVTKTDRPNEKSLYQIDSRTNQFGGTIGEQPMFEMNPFDGGIPATLSLRDLNDLERIYFAFDPHAQNATPQNISLVVGLADMSKGVNTQPQVLFAKAMPADKWNGAFPFALEMNQSDTSNLLGKLQPNQENIKEGTLFIEMCASSEDRRWRQKFVVRVSNDVPYRGHAALKSGEQLGPTFSVPVQQELGYGP